MAAEFDFSPSEDLFLTQGHIMFGQDFAKIHSYFPFNQHRTTEELSQRWSILNDKLENEDKEIIEKINTSRTRFTKSTWIFTDNPPFEVQDFQTVTQPFQVPSLAERIHADSFPQPLFIRENSDMNELCLNFQFEMSSIKDVLEKTLNLCLDDQTLKNTLMSELLREFFEKGRSIALEDISKRLDIISQTADVAQRENEIQFCVKHLERILTYLSTRAQSFLPYNQSNYQNQPHQSIENEFLKSISQLFVFSKSVLNGVVMYPSVIQGLRTSFKNKLIQTLGHLTSHFVNSNQRLLICKGFIEETFRLDPEKTFESFISPPQLQKAIASMRQTTANLQ